MLKHSQAFEGTRLLGNWMLNSWLDGVCIWSCSKWLPCRNDLLISSLSSAVLSLLVCAWICLAVWKTERETVTASQWSDLRWRDFVANYRDWAWKNVLRMGNTVQIGFKASSKLPYCSFWSNILFLRIKKQFDRSVILSHHISGVICTMLPLCRILSTFVTLVSLWPSSAVEVF